MPFTAEDKVTVRLLKEELEGWRPFVEALRFEDRQVAREMMESCWRYVEAVEQSGKEFLTEPFFLTVLLAEEWCRLMCTGIRPWTRKSTTTHSGDWLTGGHPLW